MNILRKIEDKTYQNADLINNIDLNPIVSYHIIKEIVNSKINDINVINKLIEISVRLSVNDSVLGPICLGHMSLAALRKLGIDLRKVDSRSAISDYDWELVDNFYHETGKSIQLILYELKRILDEVYLGDLPLYRLAITSKLEEKGRFLLRLKEIGIIK